MQFVHALLISDNINIIQSGQNLFLSKIYRERDVCLGEP